MLKCCLVLFNSLHFNAVHPLQHLAMILAVLRYTHRMSLSSIHSRNSRRSWISLKRQRSHSQDNSATLHYYWIGVFEIYWKVVNICVFQFADADNRLHTGEKEFGRHNCPKTEHIFHVENITFHFKCIFFYYKQDAGKNGMPLNLLGIKSRKQPCVLQILALMTLRT